MSMSSIDELLDDFERCQESHLEISSPEVQPNNDPLNPDPPFSLHKLFFSSSMPAYIPSSTFSCGTTEEKANEHRIRGRKGKMGTEEFQSGVGQSASSSTSVSPHFVHYQFPFKSASWPSFEGSEWSQDFVKVLDTYRTLGRNLDRSPETYPEKSSLKHKIAPSTDTSMCLEGFTAIQGNENTSSCEMKLSWEGNLQTSLPLDKHLSTYSNFQGDNSNKLLTTSSMMSSAATNTTPSVSTPEPASFHSTPMGYSSAPILSSWRSDHEAGGIPKASSSPQLTSFSVSTTTTTSTKTRLETNHPDALLRPQLVTCHSRSEGNTRRHEKMANNGQYGDSRCGSDQEENDGLVFIDQSDQLTRSAYETRKRGSSLSSLKQFKLYGKDDYISSMSRQKSRPARTSCDCPACRRDDCNQCRFCFDMRKNGGHQVLRKRCIFRRCLRASKNCPS